MVRGRRESGGGGAGRQRRRLCFQHTMPPPPRSPPARLLATEEARTEAEPTGPGSCLRHGHVRVGRPNKRFPGRRSSQTVARQYGQLNITVRA